MKQWKRKKNRYSSKQLYDVLNEGQSCDQGGCTKWQDCSSWMGNEGISNVTLCVVGEIIAHFFQSEET